MRALLLTLPLLFALGSCTSPPKPPSVDPSTKRPANAAATVDLQVCRGELHNTRILASEISRRADSATATVSQLVAMRHASEGRVAPAPFGNAVYTVHFAFGRSDLLVPEPEASTLIDQARKAAMVVTRGRTDGDVESPAESRVARERAAAARAFLVQAGIDPARIRTTYQPVGDHASDNGTPEGRALNRRVEIELYGVAPQVWVAGQATSVSDAEASAQ
jgi:outer membrane protein OmpA-like peptidoglycan-associated protein